jgi:hypothetical protein
MLGDTPSSSPTHQDSAMTVTGYSDRINHALAFAAKHHDRQVHKGTRAPYRTAAANVGMILARYAQPDDTVVAGILLDVVEDLVRERHSRESLHDRIAPKFGDGVVALLLSIAPRLNDAHGVEFTGDERRADLLQRLEAAPDGARWLCAASVVHEAGSILADLRRTIDADSVWGRLPAGRTAAADWYRQLQRRLRDLGFDAPIMRELAAMVDELEERARG